MEMMFRDRERNDPSTNISTKIYKCGRASRALPAQSCDIFKGYHENVQQENTC